MTSTTARADFADWLSPMLVKELRQGMRSRAFMSAFLITQLLMILSVAFNLVSASGDEAGDGMSQFLNGLFWVMIGLPLLCVMPLRGFWSLHSEIKDGTLELVFLTHLSAWRIAVGKWTALTMQTLLLVCAVLPYVLLRYFLGGVDILADLEGLLLLFIGSITFTAATVAMSPFESKLLRGLFILGMIFFLLFLLTYFVVWLVSQRIGGMSTGATNLSGILLCGGIFVVAVVSLALEIASSKIAPPAENHAIRKRLIGLGVLLLSPILVLLGLNAQGVDIATLVFLTPVVIDALAEPMQRVRAIYQGLLQRGIIGRIAVIFFTPGWVSALWYSLLVACLGGILLKIHGQWADLTLVYLSWFGALLFPAMLIRIWLPSSKHFLGLYIGLQVFFGAITLLASAMSNISNQPMIEWLFPVPSCVFLLSINDQIKPDQVSAAIACTMGMAFVSTVVLAFKAIAPSRDIRAMLRQSKSN